jgi:TolB protein
MQTSPLSGGSRVAWLLITAAIVSFAGSRAETALSVTRTFPGNDGELAVVKDRHRPDGGGNGTGIFVVRPDGSQGHWFTHGRGYDPSWSPDGKTLLFARRGGALGTADLWIADRRDQHETRISSFPYDFLGRSADWSPDGTSVVLGGRNGIYVGRLIGGRLNRVLRLTRAFIYGGPVWSPTAPEIAFVRTRNHGDQLAIVDAAGGRVHVVAATNLGFAGPSWSPNGRELAFLRCTTRGTGLSVIRRDGSGLRDLLRQATLRAGKGVCVSGQTAWSPDGRQIAFIAGGDSGASLQVVALDGRNRRIILRNIDGCCRVSWQPLRR